MSHRRSILLASVLVTLCSLPSRALAGAWTQQEGTVWTKVSVFHMSSDRIFVDSVRAEEEECRGQPLEAGDRAPYDCTLPNGGGIKTTQLFLDVVFGLHRRVDLRLQIPVILNGAVKTAGVDDNSRGIGDVRFGTQLLILPEPVVASVNIRAKAPTGDFPVDALAFPLGEGQWDLYSRGLLAKSFLEGKMWAGIEGGYRVRFDNDEVTPSLDVGDEVVALADVGGRALPWLYAQLRTELTWGFTTTAQRGAILGGELDVSETRRVIVEPKLMIQPFRHFDVDVPDDLVGDFGIEWGVRVPVWGRNWPADPIWFVGISNTFRVFEPYSSGDG